jgi:hypothetical protein
MEEGIARWEGWCMRKEQQEEKIGVRERNNRKERLVDEKGTAGKTGWWMSIRYSSKGRLVDEEVTAEKVASSVH